jgi:hypothetical protein
MRRAAVVLSVLSVMFWVLAALSTWAGFDPRAVDIEAGAAVAITSLTGACLIAYGVRDRDKDALVLAIADFTQRRGSAPTRPEVRLHLRQVPAQTRPERLLHVVDGTRPR